MAEKDEYGRDEVMAALERMASFTRDLEASRKANKPAGDDSDASGPAAVLAPQSNTVRLRDGSEFTLAPPPPAPKPKPKEESPSFSLRM